MGTNCLRPRHRSDLPTTPPQRPSDEGSSGVCRGRPCTRQRSVARESRSTSASQFDPHFVRIDRRDRAARTDATLMPRPQITSHDHGSLARMMSRVGRSRSSHIRAIASRSVPGRPTALSSGHGATRPPAKTRKINNRTSKRLQRRLAASSVHCNGLVADPSRAATRLDQSLVVTDRGVVGQSAAVLVTVGVFAVGGAFTTRAARRLIEDDTLWVGSAKGEINSEFVATAGRLKAGFRIELFGIFVVLALMEVLRFA